MAGFIVKFDKKYERDMGGVIGLKIMTRDDFYVRKGRRSANKVDAAIMTEAVANQVMALYHGENPQLTETVFHDRLAESLVEIGEAEAVIEPPPALAQLENLTRKCIEEGVARKDILGVVAAAVLDGVK